MRSDFFFKTHVNLLLSNHKPPGAVNGVCVCVNTHTHNTHTHTHNCIALSSINKVCMYVCMYGHHDI